MAVLRSRPFRSVHLEAGPDGALLVVKRFHHGGLRGLLDGARARRELAALDTLHRAGLPVPEPHGVARADGAWELRMTAVPEAVDLASLLALRAPPPHGWERLCARLGRLLARLQELGFEHGDLHPGNVLVDADGAPWLVDVQRVRRAAATPERRLAALAECEAAAREALPPRIRARFLVAWWRAVRGSDAHAAPSASPRELAARVARDGRALRARRVQEGLGRWLRESSRVRAVELDGRRAWARRDLDDGAVAQLAAEPGARLLALSGSAHELESRWLGAARLHEHGLAVARPALLVPGRRALFELPVHTAESGAALLAQLAERALVLRDASDVLFEARGAAWLRPPRAQDVVTERVR